MEKKGGGEGPLDIQINVFTYLFINMINLLDGNQAVEEKFVILGVIH